MRGKLSNWAEPKPEIGRRPQSLDTLPNGDQDDNTADTKERGTPLRHPVTEAARFGLRLHHSTARSKRLGTQRIYLESVWKQRCGM